MLLAQRSQGSRHITGSQFDSCPIGSYILDSFVYQVFIRLVPGIRPVLSLREIVRKVSLFMAFTVCEGRRY